MCRTPTTFDTWTAIRDQAESLANLGFNWDGDDGLPARGDVLRVIREIISGADWGGIADPVVKIHGDGTILIELTHEGRCLDLDVKCLGVVAFLKTFPDGETQISGAVIASDHGTSLYAEFVGEVDKLLCWLREG